MGELIQGYQRLGRVPHFGSSAQRLEGLYRAVSNLCIWAWSREASSACGLSVASLAASFLCLFGLMLWVSGLRLDMGVGRS